jgi:acyl-coenzyme A synthetase/AMP-(fatty) acid ligase
MYSCWIICALDCVLTRNQVPPIIIMMTKSKDALAKYDLSSVNAIITGAAPLGKETAEDLHRMYPKWVVRQAYGKRQHTRLHDIAANPT